MEDSFRVRVDKIFGSLGTRKPPSSSVSIAPSLWCLTDQEIERQQWNRSKQKEADDDPVESGPSDSSNQRESDLQLLSDLDEEEDEEEEEEEEEEIKGAKENRVCSTNNGTKRIIDEDWDVKSNIGRDCTLDYEDEEDEYDKVAAGTEQSGDRVYMKDVKFADSGADELDTYAELPNSYQAVSRDPRANHVAAKKRLKEDAEAAGNFHSLQLSDDSVVKDMDSEHLKKEDIDVNPKSILKKRETPTDSRLQKRVRFMFGGSQNYEEQQPSGATDLASEPISTNDSAVPGQASERSQYSYNVPDYLKNPSKYTRYTFDSSEDMDDQSNQKAYADFFCYLRGRDNGNPSPDDSAVDVPKSLVFTPKRKTEGESTVKRSKCEESTGENLEKKAWCISVTAEDTQESETCAMEEDEQDLQVDKGCSLPKPGRRYRARPNVNTEDNLTE